MINTKRKYNHIWEDVTAAITIAAQAHYGQKDKSGKPYILHPLEVMRIIEKKDFPEDRKIFLMICAVFHDVYEDCETYYKNWVKERFGSEVDYVVTVLTKEKGESYQDYLLPIKYDEDALEVKKADIEHNSCEERLKNLPQKEQDYLRNKYLKVAKEILEI